MADPSRPDAQQIAEQIAQQVVIHSCTHYAMCSCNFSLRLKLATKVITKALTEATATAEAERYRAKQLYEMTLDNEQRWMRLHSEVSAQLTEARRQAFMAGFLAAPNLTEDGSAYWRFDVEGQPMAADLAEPAYAAWILAQTEETR